MTDDDVMGVPAAELSDEELESQGTQAHATRNWVFLHGSAEQFARHTSRMLELEREYLRRHPKRTWQGTGGAAAGTEATAATDPADAFLGRLADAGGTMHKLEAHQAAREAGLDRAALAGLYKADPPFVAADGDSRVLTERGRDRVRGAHAG
jgi:hypothetical protein